MPKILKCCIVVHYSEIGLKGGNRRAFEEQLASNIRRVLKDILNPQIERGYGRFLVHLPDTVDWLAIQTRIAKVVGLANFALAELVNQDIDEITESAVRQMKQLTFSSFRVLTRRSQKNFPLKSMQVDRAVGGEIQDQSGAKVDLKNPQTTCYIEIFDNEAVVYCQKLPGLRGLPVGTGERAVSLLSSGIDSPVASWKIITRGVKLSFVHFHSAPYTSLASMENTKRLVVRLTEYQMTSKLYCVPFIEIQQSITTKAPPDYAVVLYRRSMLRIAEIIARKEKANALVTGESIGQVASQTLSNMRVINEVTELPVLRPLSGDDKEQIISLARKIDTFDISTEPYDDCCSLFVPKHPVIRAIPKVVYEAEEKLDIHEMEKQAIDKIKIFRFRFPPNS